MSRKRISARRAKERATRDEKATIQASKSTDSFQNFTAKLGIGTDNMMSASTYGFNPISRVRTLLEWIHRGSWVGGIAVDVVADDMTRAGVELKGVDPEQMEQIEESVVSLGVWPAISDTVKWSRLYGGCIAVMLVDGQDVSTPLRLNTIKKGQFRGLLVLDRWMVEPTLEDLVTQMGPDMGLPKYYVVTADAPALQRMKIHYSRCIRLEGIRLPYWQRVMENLWGISVLERLYDRMVAFDSATTGAAQLVYKSYLRTLKVDGMREIISSGGPAQDGLIKYVNMMTRFQGIEGVTMIDAKDEFQVDGHSAFSGLGDALLQFGQQLSGALQIPLVRLFGQSPAGLNASGESDLRTYYDNIKQRQERDLKVGVTKIYRATAASEGIVLDDKTFKVMFRPLWQLTDEQKSTIANTTVDAIGKAEEQGIITRAVALKELRQSSEITGIFTNITDEDIEEAENEPPPIPESELGIPENARVTAKIEENGNDPNAKPATDPGKSQKPGE
jgi:phage-related protein (TIGR01555 family)